MRLTDDTVASGGDMIALLARLAAGLGPDAPSVDDFLLRWAAVLDGHDTADPGWSGLAGQLRAALAATPAGAVGPAALPVSAEDGVDSPQALRRYLALLAADFVLDRQEMAAVAARGGWTGDGGRWSYARLPDVLDTWASWLAAVLDRPGGRPWAPPVEPVTWASVAEQLGAARVYE
ncbi:hypothetical protein [Kitasatospora sp. NPDC059571]|uniref:hypothetical protein n=1 Tax=Kitasatospora sp. NPDC059571 TaxID=3346871 RepID=UPI0036AD4EC4